MSIPLVSIIVPIYKVEAWLPRCLKSIAAQTCRDFECVLVDDGSPDGCGAICDEWAASDPRFIVIHKQNGGLSSARNAGLAAAQGEWIAFIDSDDAVHPQLLELAVHAQAEAPPYTQVLWQRGPAYSSAPLAACWEPRQIDKLYLDGDFPSACTRLWSRTTLTSFNLGFNEEVRWAEDLDFTSRYLLALVRHGITPAFRMIPHTLYLYEEQRPGSLTASASSPKLEWELRLLPQVLDVFEAILGKDAARWAPLCQVQLFTLIALLMDRYQHQAACPFRLRRSEFRTMLSSPAARRLLALCRRYHVWPAMQLCANHGLVRTAFFLERNCYTPWYTKTTRTWLWVKNKFYWGWQAIKSPFARGKD